MIVALITAEQGGPPTVVISFGKKNMSIFIAELGIEYRIRPAGNYHRTGKQEDGGVLPGAKRKLPIILLCHGVHSGSYEPNGISE